MNNKNIEAVLDRLMSALSVNNDSELARALGVNRQTLASWKSRKSVPYAICINLAEDKGWSLDWLLTGNGEMFTKSSTKTNEANEPSVPYSHSDQKLLELLGQLDPDVKKDLLRRAGEKQRILDLEKQMEKLTAELESIKRSA
ncbi:bacteriophage CI repressor [Salmonella enterica subsp. enterica serovar Llandoff]|nr:bacteriophage CI repressor [Salmonella enterica subsp. enterica serovar Llandoff]ECO4188315.1 bacteriophage CI repressor [Salmonella enterica]